MESIKKAKIWLGVMTDGGYCETSDCNFIINSLIKDIEKLQEEIQGMHEDLAGVDI